MKITIRVDESFHSSNRIGLEVGQLVRVEAVIEEQGDDRYYNVSQWPGNDKGLSIPVGDDCVVSVSIPACRECNAHPALMGGLCERCTR